MCILSFVLLLVLGVMAEIEPCSFVSESLLLFDVPSQLLLDVYLHYISLLPGLSHEIEMGDRWLMDGYLEHYFDMSFW